MKKIEIFLLAMFMVAAGQTKAQQHGKAFPREMMSYFVGEWTGSGFFANGKPISSDCSFELAPNGDWLIQKHADNKPHNFHAVSIWGVDAATGKAFAHLFDNSNHLRHFSSEGWKDNKISFILKDTSSIGKPRLQRFDYHRLDDDQFRMAFLLSVNGNDWKLIDSIDFKRKQLCHEFSHEGRIKTK